MTISVSELVQNIISEMQGGSAKFLLISLGMMMITGGVLSQNTGYFLQSLRVNSGFTFVGDSQDEYHKHREITWSNQVSVSIIQGLYAGVQVYSIYTWGTRVENENFFLQGVFLQYDFVRKEKPMTFLEVSYNQGDYCTCRRDDPFRKIGLEYIGVGVGLDYPIMESNFYASGSFIIHGILGDVPGKYGYNIYKIGLSYKFGKI